MNYRVISILFLALFISGLAWTAARQKEAASGIPGSDIARAMAGPQESLSEASAPLRHFSIKGPGGTVRGYVFFTADLAPDVQGYGGRIPLAVKVDPRGRIEDVRLLPNNETRAYTGDLDHFVRQFIGKTPADPLELKTDVDAVAGATVTSEALARTVRSSLAEFSAKVLSAAPAAVPARTRPMWDKIFFSLAVFGLCLAAILTASASLRWAAMAAGFVYFGIMTATMLSIVQVANIGLLNIPAFSANPLWWMTIGFAFAAALVIGRAHCSSVCPFALVQEVLYRLMRRRVAVNKIDPRLYQRTRSLKYWFLFAILAATFVLGNASAANIEPFVTLFRGHGTKLAWSFLILMLIVSIFHFRFWCAYFCPVGALTGLAARLSLYKIIPAESCSRCRKCAGLCPVKAISYMPAEGRARAAGTNEATDTPRSPGRIEIDEAECILCGRCLKGCPESKLALRNRYEKT